MISRKRVAVAMSGGVDSSVSAAILHQEGYEVIGITHQIWPSDKQAFGGCCGLDAIDSARSVAGKLGIPYYVLDLREEFASKVIAEFCREYGVARTPNPCVLCNQFIRFQVMLDKVLKMGIDFMATGHYVRREETKDGFRLLKAVDLTKDQSYFLYTLGQKELRYLLFPNGSYQKIEIREMAYRMGLLSAYRKESQDICFIREDYRSFISRSVALHPGDIITGEGKVIGRHDGLAFYTIGQRHGMRIASKEPLYVLKLDKENNRVIVGPRNRLFSNVLTASKINWISGQPPQEESEVTAKIRYRAPESIAMLTFKDNTVKVKFKQPQLAITPGQSIVFYRGEEVLGGGIIEEAGS